VELLASIWRRLKSIDKAGIKIWCCSTFDAQNTTFLTSEHWPERCNLLEKVTPRVNKDGDKTAALVAAYMLSQIANETMKTIVRSDENEDWREELRMIGEIERPLAICMEMLGKVKRHHTNQEFFRKAFDIKDSISDSRMKYLCRAYSLRHRSIAYLS
jgi:hypothetical protein